MKFWAALIATLVIIGGIFGMAWWIRELQTDLKTRTDERDAAQAVADYRALVIDNRNALIAAREKSAAAHKDFLAQQAEEMEKIQNDAEVDSNILGPAYFNSLQRPRRNR